MGKSQLAIGLGGRRTYFYWLATPLESKSQSLYQNFSTISAAFLKLSRKITQQRRTGLMWTYGFIRALLEYCSSDEHQNTSRMIRFDNQTVLKMK
ncbi:hypothetical protein Plhal703r1_c04g0022721 [Plasmopara halstedii]